MTKHCLHCAMGPCFSLFVCNSFVGPTLKTREQCLTLQNVLPKRTPNMCLSSSKCAFAFLARSQGTVHDPSKLSKT